MAREQLLTSLDLEDLTPRQLRKVLSGLTRSQLPYARKTAEEQEEDKERSAEESEALADLHREKKGDSKPPKVLESDLPKGAKVDVEEDDEEEEEKPTKKKRS